jgi:hypothetical protein
MTRYVSYSRRRKWDDKAPTKKLRLHNDILIESRGDASAGLTHLTR